MYKYTLSDSDMLGITEAIDNSKTGSDVIFFGIRATWNAILAREGMSWNDFNCYNPLDPTAYGIPRDQSNEIAERMKKRAMQLGVSDIGVTNILLDYMNHGPSYYDN